jgi:hypothetical protein
MQKEVRDGSKPDEKVPKKNFYNTVAHVEHGQKSYVLHATSVGNVLRMNLGFLLNNGLLGYRLQFFVDGQKTLHASIVKAFSWFSNIGLLLDWYHLEEKCKKQLSLGMKGRDLRKQILEAVLALLWRGRVQAAIQALQTLNPDGVKNRHELVVLVNYWDRNRPYIPCYCVRKHLGLRNSSNIGEKMNDLIVSDRQKHNGMSWSKMGSTAQASIEVLKRNHEVASWLQQGDLAFSLAA